MAKIIAIDNQVVSIGIDGGIKEVRTSRSVRRINNLIMTSRRPPT